MAIKFTCECGKTYSAKDEHAGKKVKCIACVRDLTIPSAQLQASPASALIAVKVDADDLAYIPPPVSKIETGPPETGVPHDSASYPGTWTRHVYLLAGRGSCWS